MWYKQQTTNKQTNKTKKQTETSICKIGKSNQVNAAEVVIDYELSTIKSAKTTNNYCIIYCHILQSFTIPSYNWDFDIRFTLWWVPRQTQCCSSIIPCANTLPRNQVSSECTGFRQAKCLIISGNGLTIPRRHQHICHQIMSSFLAKEINTKQIGDKDTILLFQLRNSSSAWQEGLDAAGMILLVLMKLCQVHLHRIFYILPFLRCLSFVDSR